MKNKNIHISYIVTGFVTVLLIMFFVLFSHQTVQKGLSEGKLIKKWDKLMAREINKDTITVKVDNKNIEAQECYMSNQMELMIPLRVLTDAFNCAQNLYKNKLVIQKANNRAVIKIGENKIKVNNSEFKLKDKAVRKGEEIYVPISVFSKFMGYEYIWNSDTNTASLKNTSKGSFLPERYSYVEEGRAPKTHNQGDLGTCWAFATLSAIESALLPEQKYEFSEDNLIYNNLLADEIKNGGDYIMSMAYLMSWKGPVLEKDDPYNDGKHADIDAVKHIQEAEILPSKDYNQIKEKIFKYGGVESSLYMSMDGPDSSSKYYNRNQYAYCYKGENSPNHDVVIIGWDNNYPKESFNDSRIKNNGAFICQNSWGEDFGDKGIFFVSYEDDRIGENNVCYTKIEDTDNYDRLYQSDLCGWTGTMGFADSHTAYFSNIFRAKDNEKLSAVGFYATEQNLEYQVFVCERYNDMKSLNERNHIAAQGTINNKGYYTVKLDKLYQLVRGSKFSITVKITDRKSKNYKLIPVELKTSDMNSNIDLDDEEGYFSSEGTNWQSAEKQECNICLKAYTVK